MNGFVLLAQRMMSYWGETVCEMCNKPKLEKLLIYAWLTRTKNPDFFSSYVLLLCEHLIDWLIGWFCVIVIFST